MKNFSLIFLVCLIFFFICTDTNARGYRVDDVVEKQFVMNKKFQLNLPKGKWVVAHRDIGDYYNLATKVYSLVRLENNFVVE